jgi:hypothetical protein
MSVIFRDVMSSALEAHSIAYVVRNDAVELPDSSVSFSAKVQNGPAQTNGVLLQLDVTTSAPLLGGRVIQQSFAGLGDDRKSAEHNAFGKFLLTSFHVILSGLASHSCEQDGTEWSVWGSGDAQWRVCDSPLIMQGGDPTTVGYPAYVKRLEALFVRQASQGLHWCETFFCSLNGSLVGTDIRLDNVTWQAALEALEAWHIAPPEGYRSGRHFFLAMPIQK